MSLASESLNLEASPLADSAALTFAATTPDTVVDVVCQGVFEALSGDRAGGANLASPIDTYSITRKEGVGRICPACSLGHPLCGGFIIHVSIISLCEGGSVRFARREAESTRPIHLTMWIKREFPTTHSQARPPEPSQSCLDQDVTQRRYPVVFPVSVPDDTVIDISHPDESRSIHD